MAINGQLALPLIMFKTNYEACFENAYKKGAFSKGEPYMYMFTQGDIDWFKHKVTREDVKVDAT